MASGAIFGAFFGPMGPRSKRGNGTLWFERARELTFGAILVLGGLPLGCKRRASVGLDACDAYVEKYDACIGAMGPRARARSEPSFRAEQVSLKEGATDPEQRAVLALDCRIALENIRGVCP